MLCYRNKIYDPVNTVLVYHIKLWIHKKAAQKPRRDKEEVVAATASKEIQYAKRNEVRNKELVKENLKDLRWYTIK